MVLQLYGANLSTNTARVLATLYEKDVTDFEYIKVDLKNGEHKKPEFVEMQPFGVVPLLVEGDLKLFESRAIARFISHKFESQGTPLYGSTPKDKALVEQWLEVEGQNYNPAVATIVMEIMFKPLFGGKTDEAVVKSNLEKLGKVLDIYEAQLCKSKYLAGDFFSLADLSHLPFTHYLVTVAKSGDVIDVRPHVKAWWEDISNRPSWKKVLATTAEK